MHNLLAKRSIGQHASRDDVVFNEAGRYGWCAKVGPCRNCDCKLTSASQHPLSLATVFPAAQSQPATKSAGVLGQCHPLSMPTKVAVCRNETHIYPQTTLFPCPRDRSFSRKLYLFSSPNTSSPWRHQEGSVGRAASSLVGRRPAEREPVDSS